MFRLKRFKISDNKIFCGTEIVFFEDNEKDSDTPYTTVIIGTNGVGKSILLAKIINVFNCLHKYIYSDSNRFNIDFDFELVYSIDNNEIEVLRGDAYKENSKKFKILLNGRQITDDLKKDIPLPKTILSVSSLITDKFNSKSTDFYKYLGIRDKNSSSIARTKNVIKSLVNSIFERLKEDFGFYNKMKKTFDFISNNLSFSVSYEKNKKLTLWNGKLDKESFISEFKEMKERRILESKTIPFASEKFEKMQYDDKNITDILKFLNQNSDRELLYNFDNDIDTFLKEYDIIKQLASLDIIRYPSLHINMDSNKVGYSLFDASSGESSLFISFLNLLCHIDENSLILIDEPEVSLHPEWQMQYIPQLQKTFANNASSHFIITTHSHFLLSDLKPEESRSVIMEKDSHGNISAEINPLTYARSPEEILYRVFKVRGVRNIFFEQDLAKFIEILENFHESKRLELENLLTHISKYELSADDPLTELMHLAREL